jgi:predicted MFS family arabinose efflux permease
VAIITLAATPFEVSVLRVAGHAPALVLGLLAGVWVDRLRRRPILIWTDIGRALLVASIPLAAALHVLGMEQLYVVALVTGGLGTLFEVAYRSYLPSLVEKEQLVEGNSKLTASASVAEVAGFGLAGALVQWLTAPAALLVDAASFLVSAVSLGLIRRPEPPPTVAADRGSTWQEVEEALRAIAADRTLRAVSAAKLIGEFAIGGVWASVLLLFILRDLGLEPWLMTATFAVGGVSAFFGALAADRLIHRWGAGRAMIGSTLAYRLTPFLLPLAGGPFGFVLFCLVMIQAADAAATVQDVAETSLVQGNVPNRVLGQGAILSGTLIGGVLGELIGLRLTMLVGACLGVLAIVVLLASPLRTNRDYAQVT